MCAPRPASRLPGPRRSRADESASTTLGADATLGAGMTLGADATLGARVSLRHAHSRAGLGCLIVLPGADCRADLRNTSVISPEGAILPRPHYPGHFHRQ